VAQAERRVPGPPPLVGLPNLTRGNLWLHFRHERGKVARCAHGVRYLFPAKMRVSEAGGGDPVEMRRDEGIKAGDGISRTREAHVGRSFLHRGSVDCWVSRDVLRPVELKVAVRKAVLVASVYGVIMAGCH
jgi:hypothetical protein